MGVENLLLSLMVLCDPCSRAHLVVVVLIVVTCKLLTI